MKKKNDNEVEQLSSFPLFKGFSKVYKSKLIHGMKTIYLVRGNSLFKENDFVYKNSDKLNDCLSTTKTKMIHDYAGCFYFSLKGEFEVCKTITIYRTGINTKIEYNGLEIPEKLKNELGDDYSKISSLERRGQQEIISASDVLKTKKIKKRIQLCIMGEKEIIGGDEYIFDNMTRFTEVTCISESAKLLVMKMEDVARLRKLDNLEFLK